MHKQFSYPVCLSLAGIAPLIVGYGKVGRRKLHGLLAAGAENVLVLDPFVNAACIEPFTTNQKLYFEARNCRYEDIYGGRLVFACTSSVEENRRISALCDAAGALCNSASDPDRGSFIVPAVARNGDLIAAISTGGQSPALARKWSRELQAWLNVRYKITWLFGKLRVPVLQAGLTQQENAALFNSLASSRLAEFLEKDELDSCYSLLSLLLPKELQLTLEEILSEYRHVFP